jgi:hypothetical protein
MSKESKKTREHSQPQELRLTGCSVVSDAIELALI